MLIGILRSIIRLKDIWCTGSLAASTVRPRIVHDHGGILLEDLLKIEPCCCDPLLLFDLCVVQLGQCLELADHIWPVVGVFGAGVGCKPEYFQVG